MSMRTSTFPFPPAGGCPSSHHGRGHPRGAAASIHQEGSRHLQGAGPQRRPLFAGAVTTLCRLPPCFHAACLPAWTHLAFLPSRCFFFLRCFSPVHRFSCGSYRFHALSLLILVLSVVYTIFQLVWCHALKIYNIELTPPPYRHTFPHRLLHISPCRIPDHLYSHQPHHSLLSSSRLSFPSNPRCFLSPSNLPFASPFPDRRRPAHY